MARKSMATFGIEGGSRRQHRDRPRPELTAASGRQSMELLASTLIRSSIYLYEASR